ncbi:alpha beta-hydrolase [Ophiostoma piceae UAMH 11346]|uniref:Alpha beta-hydrolase n=1 Tax=Ophiostoma piceae (strain UAMH 11346) TaxID=1262450 RepID=S3CC33_OPHP1|nr:alpha beta-hydrolase [Ophiostoma piceae UAMH 11346]
MAGASIPERAVDKPDPADYIEAHILPRMDPEIVDYITPMVKNLPAKPATIEDIRANPAAFRGRISVDTSEGFEGMTQYELTSKDGGTFPIRVYHPHGAAAQENLGAVGATANAGAGVHINFHGGGFVLGDLYTEAQLCLSMREAGIVVVDVNYRHCPDTLWGKCFEDAWAVLLWVRENASSLKVNPASLSIGGVSAGGYISTVLHQRARDEGIPLRLVMPTVPATSGSLFYDFYTDSPFSSFHEFVRTPILSWARIQSFAGMVVDSVTDEQAGVDRSDAAAASRKKKIAFLKKTWPTEWVAPLSNTNFKDLAPVFVRTAELDLLRDEGEAYAMAVVKAGGTATLKRYPGTLHTFMFLDFGVQKHAYDVDSIVALRQAHGLAPLALDEIKARVDRVLAEVKAQQQREKEQGKKY